MKIKAVLFDLNGVLLGPSDNYLSSSNSKTSHINQALIQTARKLKKSGIKTGIITNVRADKPSLEELFEVSIEELFDVIVSSSKVGALKPNPKIYKAALDNLNTSSQETLLIDDRHNNVKGAKDIGMQAFYFQGTKSTIEKLKDLDLLPEHFNPFNK